MATAGPVGWGLPKQKGPLASPWPVPCVATVVLSCRFTPSLRQLKQQALLLHVPPTLPSRLVQRLQEVSRAGSQLPVGYAASVPTSLPMFFPTEHPGSTLY